MCSAKINQLILKTTNTIFLFFYCAVKNPVGFFPKPLYEFKYLSVCIPRTGDVKEYSNF